MSFAELFLNKRYEFSNLKCTFVSVLDGSTKVNSLFAYTLQLPPNILCL